MSSTPTSPAQSEPPIDPDAFVEIVKPQIEQLDPAALLAFLKARWTAPQVVSLLTSHHDTARKIAAVCISLVGTPLCIPATAELLKHPCHTTNQLAEHALWSIWFRAGSDEANHHLARGVRAIERRDFDHAVEHFDRAIELSPNFAEAYNQRGLAKYLLDQYEDSIADCRIALKLMPCHFACLAGIGHNYMHLGDLTRAIEAYDAALAINPHMHCVRETVDELRRRASNATEAEDCDDCGCGCDDDDDSND